MNEWHELITRTPEETMALGERWAAEAKAGWVIGLSGDLGAGKTQLVKGLARGLGCQGRVSSPTFGLINEYSGGRLPLAHLDLYRLDTPEQIIGAGLEPYLVQPEGVSVVEWIERWWPDPKIDGSAAYWMAKEIVKEPCCPVRLAVIDTLDETKRRIRYVDFDV